MADGFRIAAAWVEVKPDLEGFAEELKEKLDQATAGVSAKARVSLDTSELDAKVDMAKAKVDELDSTRAEPSVHLNDENLSRSADEAKAKLDELDNRSARPDVGLDAGNLDAHIEDARAKIEALDSETADPRLNLDTAEFDAKVDEAKAKLAELSAESAKVSIDANGRRRDARGRFVSGGAGGELPSLPSVDEGGESRLRSMLQRLTQAGDKGGEWLGNAGGGIARFFGEHTLATGLTAGITGLLPGLAGAGAGLGLLGGAGALAFGGIAHAIEAGDQASNSPGIPAAQRALTNFTNQVAVQNAQQQVGNAQQQAAQDAITSAQNIAQAQQNLASVERNAAEQQVMALQSVKQAEQGVEEANYALSQAQYNLNQAWEAARENIRQLNDQLADSKLSVEAAKLAVQQAEYQQKLVDQNAYSTALDKQQAALAVAQAQQQVKDATDQQTAAQYAANQANKQGVAGSQAVIQAKQGLIQAQYGQTNAQQQYANAQRQLTLTELNDQAQIKAAHMQLAAAEEQAAFQRRQDAQNIANAQQNLTNTLKEQKLQQAATAAEANQAATQFQQDMAKLTPAARGVVNEILGMRGAFRQLQSVAQNAVAPGLTAFIKGLSVSMPAITAGIGKVAGVLGNAFGNIGKALQSTSGAQVLQGLINNGVRFAQIVIPALGGFAGALARVGSQKGAVDGIANLIGGLAGGLKNLVTSVGPFTGALSSIGTTLGKALAPVGTLLGGVVGQLAKTLAPMLQALLPDFQQLVGTLGGALTSALSAAAPGLQTIVTAFAQILPAVNPLISLLGGGLAIGLRVVSGLLQGLNELLGGNLSWLQPIVTGVVAIVGAVKAWTIVQAAWNLIMEANPLVLFGTLLAGVVVSVVYAYNHFAWFRDGVQGAFKVISESALWMWHNVLDPMWHGIETGASWLYNNAIQPLWTGIKTAFSGIEAAASWMWHNVFDPLWQGISAGARGFVAVFKAIWETLEGIFKTPVNFLIQYVYQDGIEKLWNGVVNAVGAGKLALPDIHTLATGGVLPGYAPGKDTIPAVLSPGEGVLVPEAVRAIGPGTVHALNAEYGGGRVTRNNHYSGGGIGGAIGSLLGGALDVGKIVAAVLTGNSTALSNALGKYVSTKGAAGHYAEMLLDIPTKLIGTAVHSLMTYLNGVGHLSNIGGSIPSGQHLSIIDQALAAAGVPPPGTKGQWEAGLNTLITRESSWNPNAINLWDSNAKAGHPSQGLMQTIPSTWSEYVPAALRSRGILDPIANVAAGIRYIVADYGNITNVQQANANMPPKGYDNGGWLMPGDYGTNRLRRPEAVLTPDESAWLKAAASSGVAQQRASGNDRPVIVNFHYSGTEHPSAEMQAQMRRDMAIALSGV